jgi:hypothetical protein
MPTYKFLNAHKFLVQELETCCLMLNCTSSQKWLFQYVSLATIVQHKQLFFLN